MALVLALAVLAAVLLAQSPLGVVLGSGLFDSPLATPTPARYVGAPLAVGTTPRFEIVQEGGVWHYRVDGTDVTGLPAAATALNLTNLYPLALGRARNTCVTPSVCIANIVSTQRTGEAAWRTKASRIASASVNIDTSTLLITEMRGALNGTLTNRCFNLSAAGCISEQQNAR